jgi:pimeloyl-ACP methyl ester carboxylesterase
MNAQSNDWNASSGAGTNVGHYADINGLHLYYQVHGTGRPLVLLHGGLGAIEMFGPNLPALAKNHQVIALDLQGHGRTADIDRPLDPRYMADDVAALLKHLKIERADIMGYSLGSRMTAILAREQPQRLRSAILGGIGIGLIEGGGPGENVAIALEAPSLEDVTDPVGRTFRAFADQTRSDRRALAACLRGSRRLMTAEEAAGIGVPVLIAVGTKDEIAGSAAALGKIIPGAEVLDIPNRDHMRAVGDKVYKVGVTDFLSRRQ